MINARPSGTARLGDTDAVLTCEWPGCGEDGTHTVEIAILTIRKG